MQDNIIFPSFFFLKEISITKTVIKLRGFFYHLNLPSASKAFSSPGLSRPSHFLMESPGDNVDKPFKFPAFFYAQLAISEFPNILTFKTRLSAKPFIWKWVLFAWEYSGGFRPSDKGGGSGHPDPEIWRGWGAVSKKKKNFGPPPKKKFRPFGPPCGLKIRGGGGGPPGPLPWIHHWNKRLFSDQWPPISPCFGTEAWSDSEMAHLLIHFLLP